MRRPAIISSKMSVSATTRRVLIGLTLALIVLVSVGVGVVVANWPQWLAPPASGAGSR